MIGRRHARSKAATAENTDRTGSAAAGDVAIVGGRVVPITGEVIEGGTVVIIDGRISAIGAEVTLPPGIATVDATGQWVLPGLVESHGHLGVHEEGNGWAGQDTNEMTDPIGARFRALDAINPADEGFRDALAGGVTAVVVKPGSGNPIGGQTVAIKSWGRIVDEMVIAEPCSLKSALGENPKRVYGEQKKTPSTRLGVAAVIREALMKAQDYRAARDHAADQDKPFTRDLDAEVLVRVLDGEIPWCQHAHRADDIATALRLADEFGYRLVINHGTEAHLMPDVLADNDIPVIMGPLIVSRSKVEVNQRSMRNPGLLDRAGVKVAITTDHPVVPINYLVTQAALAVRDGMDRDAALRSITINPAEILGLDERVGSLDVGKDGDVVVWSGDPFDLMSRPLHVFVDGREVHTFDVETGLARTLDPYTNLPE